MIIARLRSGYELKYDSIRDLTGLEEILNDFGKEDVFDMIMIFQYRCFAVRSRLNVNEDDFNWWNSRLIQCREALTDEEFIQMKVSLELESLEQQKVFAFKMINKVLRKR